MKKAKAEEQIRAKLQSGDSLVGFFQARTSLKFWLFPLIGPFAILSMKVYFVAVSQKGVYFHKLNFFGRFQTSDYFEFAEFERVKIGKGWLQRPMTFWFKNDRKLKVHAQLKGAKQVAKLVPGVQRQIELNIPAFN